MTCVSYRSRCLNLFRIMRTHRDCVLLCTNRDAYDRHGDIMLAGNGCLVAAVETSLGRECVDVGV